jgi:TonB-linked SusC/RagA family outer membrane protein
MTKLIISKFSITIFLAMLVLFCSFTTVHGQQLKVKGTVTGDGSLLPGVSVSVKGDQVGSVTDFDGNFEIPANKDDVLVFSFVGFKTLEVDLEGRNNLEVNLIADVSELDEVVVVGYGSVKRKDLTGAVSTIKSDEIEKIKTTSFEGAIASKAAGVQVVRSEGGPDAAFKIRIRGGTSINASNDPLYVIDGFPITGGSVSTSIGQGNSSTSPLATLDPSSIESIDILKDASATAIYGSRGANGVILITTKKGVPGRSQISFESYFGVSRLANKLDVLSAQEFIDFRNDYQTWFPAFAAINDDTNQNKFLAEGFRVDDGTGTYIPIDLATMTFDPPILIDDWQDVITRSAITKNYRLSANGGNKNTRYNASFSYQDREGIIRTSEIERYTGNFNITTKLNDKLEAGFNGNVGHISRSGVVTAASNNSQGRSGIVTSAILFPPVQSPRQWFQNEYDPETGRLIANRNGDVSNPELMLSENTNTGKTLQTSLNAYLSYELAEGLTFKSSIRGFSMAVKNKAWFTNKFGWARGVGGRSITRFYNSSSLVTEQNLNYLKDFGDHRINATLVYERQQRTSENLTSNSTGFDIPNLNLDALQGALNTEPTQSYAFNSSVESFLARVQYDAFNKYLLTASLRYDGSSRFAEEKRWDYFPSLGLAWRISNESFLKNNSLISDAKLKFSYGQSGNTEIPAFKSIAQAGISSYVFGGSSLSAGSSIIQLANEDLTWESTREIDYGLSLGLFNNRITLEADYYDKETSNLLLEVPLPATSGYQTAFKNLGLVSNKGYEFALNANMIENSDFNWNMNFNISFNENKVLDLGDADEFFVTAIGDNQTNNDYVVRVGESLGSIYGLAYDGVYNYQDFVEFDGMSIDEANAKLVADAAAVGDGTEMWWTLNQYTLKEGVPVNALVTNGTYRPGMTKFKDINGDGVINDDDRHIIGNTLPKHFGGMTQNFNYKNFDLSVQTSWSYGNDVYNKTLKKGAQTAVPWRNKFSIVDDRWSPENPNGTFTAFSAGNSGDVNSAAYDLYLEDGSYFRIGNITMGYTFPKEVMKKIGIKHLRLYVSLDNVHIWTKYSGWDPDVSVGNNQLTPGLDVDSYPRSRTFRTGIVARF